MRDRVVAFKRIPASELIPNAKNWRRHPREQVEMFKELMDEIGFADVVIVREVDGGYELLDGHMRTGLLQDETLPAIIVDLDDEEADVLLATLDPLGAMAKENKERLTELQDGLREDIAQRLKDMPAFNRTVESEPSHTVRQPFTCPECGFEFGN